jgi:hypothetical protein
MRFLPAPPPPRPPTSVLRKQLAGSRREYRRQKILFIRRQVQLDANRVNLGFALLFAIITPLAYCAWQIISGIHVAWLGVFVSAVAPFVLYGGFILIRAVLDAPVAIFARQEASLEARRPPNPWLAAVELIPRSQGAAAKLRLFTNGQDAPALKVTCYVHLPSYRAEAKEPVVGPVTINPSAPICFVYPEEFRNPTWPLEPGEYLVQFEVEHPKDTTRAVETYINVEGRTE